MFWQSTSGRRGGRPGDPPAQDAWWRAVQLEWGVPGRGIWRDDHLVAFALFAPTLHMQRGRLLGPSPDADALILSTMWVEPEYRGAGLARHLLQVVAREAVGNGHEAVEAYGLLGSQDTLSPGSCILDGAFLEHLGFQLHRVDSETPLYRFETARTARWAEAVAGTWADVVAALSGRERAKTRPWAESPLGRVDEGRL
ncbi:MAG: GNAT family N-acetyltransferase [Euzebya sp.]